MLDNRARAQDKSQQSPSRPVRRPWSVDDQKKLDELQKAGKTGPEIAAALQRTPTSIYSQLHRLDVKRRKADRDLGLKAKK